MNQYSSRVRKKWGNGYRTSYTTDPKDLKVLEGLISGFSATRACIAAGYGKTYARCFAGKIVARAKRLVPINMINIEDLATRATDRLWEIVDRPETSVRELIPACRLAFELSGKLGQSHMHEHQLRLPPAVEAMLLNKMKETVRPQGVLSGTVVSEGNADEGSER